MRWILWKWILFNENRNILTILEFVIIWLIWQWLLNAHILALISSMVYKILLFYLSISLWVRNNFLIVILDLIWVYSPNLLIVIKNIVLRHGHFLIRSLIESKDIPLLLIRKLPNRFLSFEFIKFLISDFWEHVIKLLSSDFLAKVLPFFLDSFSFRVIVMVLVMLIWHAWQFSQWLVRRTIDKSIDCYVWMIIISNLDVGNEFEN